MKLKFNVSILLFILVIITNCLAEDAPVENKEPSPTVSAKKEQPTPESKKESGGITDDLMGFLGLNGDETKKENEPTTAEAFPENFEVVTDCDNLKKVLDSYPELSRQLSVNFQLHTMSCCNDEEFICKDVEGGRFITELNLGYKYLSGPISRSFGNFTMLQRLDLRSNKLTGSIPNDFKFLTKLEYLDLSTNNLDGEFPSFIGDMSSLKVIDFSNNNFKGSLPESLNKLYFLEKLSTRYNLISGPLTDFFSSTPNLTVLDLSLNKLEGKIPKSIKKLYNIGEIHLNNNNLEGSLPNSFSELEKLEVLYLSFNDLSGKVPDMPKSLKLCSYKDTNLCVKEDAICGVGRTPICKADYKRIIIIASSIIIGLLLVVIIIKLISRCRRRSKQFKPKQSDDQILLVGEDEIMEEGDFLQMKKINDRRAAELDEDYLVRM